MIGDYAEANDLPADTWERHEPNKFEKYLDISHLVWEDHRNYNWFDSLPEY